MAITNVHIRFLWGALTIDEAAAATPAYANPTEYAVLGDTAVEGVGIGVRRVTLALDRQAITPSDDDANMHFDFLNITAGAPDDTWTAGDFTTLENLLLTWWGTVKGQVPNYWRLHRFAWHRVGPGVVPPNPAVRLTDITTPVAGTTTDLRAPQDACSITLRTGVRRSWGRTYLPYAGVISSNGRVATAAADAVANATATLFSGALAADFHPVVVSNHLLSALGVDHVETDDVVDIQRRRRWKHTTYRKLVTVA